ncbi:MAG: hypothetical protein AB1762_16890, partial [Gemmatimonadota bacterium]
MNTTSHLLTNWRALGRVDMRRQADARLQLHHALQVIVSAPISFLPPRADDSHTNLEWLPDVEALGTNWLEGAERVRYALVPDALSLLALDDRGAVTADLPLDGRTTEDAAAWLRDALDAAGYDRAKFTTRKHYEIPTHPVATGAAYTLAPREHAELARWYANAHELTSLVADGRADAS